MWEFFPSRGPPLPPVWECHVFERKKYGLFFHFRTLETFIFGGSPMSKTVKNGSGIWADPPPPPLFCQYSHIFSFFFLLNVPRQDIVKTMAITMTLFNTEFLGSKSSLISNQCNVVGLGQHPQWHLRGIKECAEQLEEGRWRRF